ncbi:histidinol-phosphate transaminase [Desulfonema magnum]|uniref:Histidinol-phosphate aminotransferase n=1 Tax=Desulfonema magnum TaxID=45655 RepID=A0A975BQP9_9BACT|nr:histidinol-phosphate transaminase [Desulfonema magnum]QTA89810.1 Histidinol-phosphate aminotransferase [Desulfonema magnum]
MNLSVPDCVLSIKPYVPGKPLEELEREYGIKDSVKLASNENPLGSSPMALKAIQDEMENLHRYPDGSAYSLIKKLSEKLGVSPGNIVLGNGSDEVIGMLAWTLLRQGDEAILPQPSFLMYDIVVRCVGATPVYVPLKSLSIDLDGMKERITPKTRMIFVNNPNNPTGTIVTKKEFDTFLETVPPEIIIVVDEAYIEFARDQECLNGTDYLDSGRAVVTLRTFSKIYGLAGLRIGYGVMPEQVAEVLNRIRMPFNANSLAQVGAAAALDDDDFIKKTRSTIYEGLDFLCDALDRLGIRYFPTQANFFLIDVKKNANEVFEDMLRQGVIVRSMISYGFPEYIRVNVGLHEENVRLIRALETVLF